MEEDVRSELDGVRLLPVGKVAELMAISERQVWRLAKGGLIPEAVVIGARTKRWRLSDLQEFLAGR